jgi:hypothetical protein
MTSGFDTVSALPGNAGGELRVRHTVRECSTGPAVIRPMGTGTTGPVGSRDRPEGRCVAVRPSGGQSAKSQVMTVLLPTVAMPTPIRRAFGLRMFAMWFHCPGYGSAMNAEWHQSSVACWLIPMW